jgi:hypothetical protein
MLTTIFQVVLLTVSYLFTGAAPKTLKTEDRDVTTLVILLAYGITAREKDPRHINYKYYVT